jgi:predicted RNA-binding protein with TRAM domain
MNGNRFAPVQVGDELDVKIEAVGEKGDGIAKKDGFVLFVPNTNEGDEVKIRITKVLRRVGFAEVVGAGSEPAESTENSPAEEEPAEDAKADEEDAAPEEPEAPAEDSEDFGEDADKE